MARVRNMYVSSFIVNEWVLLEASLLHVEELSYSNMIVTNKLGAFNVVFRVDSTRNNQFFMLLYGIVRFHLPRV